MTTTKPSVSVKYSVSGPEKLRAGPRSHGQKRKGPGLWVVPISPVEWPPHSSLTHTLPAPSRFWAPQALPGGGSRAGTLKALCSRKLCDL